MFTATTKTALQGLESKYGMWYSILMELPLFDPIRFAVIDIFYWGQQNMQFQSGLKRVS